MMSSAGFTRAARPTRAQNAVNGLFLGPVVEQHAVDILHRLPLLHSAKLGKQRVGIFHKGEGLGKVLAQNLQLLSMQESSCITQMYR